MNTSDIINLLRQPVKSNNFGKKKSARAMDKMVDNTMRTWQDWKLGISEQQAVKAVFVFLCELDDDDILHVVKRIRKGLTRD